jgi:hypothetical protein
VNPIIDGAKRELKFFFHEFTVIKIQLIVIKTSVDDYQDISGVRSGRFSLSHHKNQH